VYSNSPLQASGEGPGVRPFLKHRAWLGDPGKRISSATRIVYFPSVLYG